MIQEWRRSTRRCRQRFSTNSDFRPVTQFPPVRSDETLVRQYFEHFFLNEASYTPYAQYIRDTYLKPIFAEAKIVSGQGDPEQWASDLSPSAFRALKERVDIDFAYPRTVVFAPDQKDLNIR